MSLARTHEDHMELVQGLDGVPYLSQLSSGKVGL